MLLAVVSKIDSVVQFITVLIIFVVVLGATWLTTRYIAGFQKGKMRGNNFEMIDSFRLSQNKYVQIIRIGGRYLAVAVCKDTVTVLTELTEDEIVRPEEFTVGTPIQFEEFLNKAKMHMHKSDTKAAEKHEEENEENFKE
jgi:flagellar protein FliO/FliZ